LGNPRAIFCLKNGNSEKSQKLRIPRQKTGKKTLFWEEFPGILCSSLQIRDSNFFLADSHAFYRGCTINFWNSLILAHTSESYLNIENCSSSFIFPIIFRLIIVLPRLFHSLFLLMAVDNMKVFLGKFQVKYVQTLEFSTRNLL